MWLIKPLKFSYTNAKCRAIKSTLLDISVFERLTNSATIGDIIIVIKDTPYGKFIKSVLQESLGKGLDNYFLYLFEKITEKLSKKEKDIFFLFFMERENLRKRKKEIQQKPNAKELFKKLDMEYVTALKKNITVLDRKDVKDLGVITGSYFNLINIITTVRLKFIYGYKKENIFPFLIPFGSFTKKENIEKLLNMEKISQLHILFPSIFKKTVKDFTEMRKALYRYHTETLKKVWLGFPFKLSVPFALLRLIEIEIKNIKACIEGVRLGLPEEEIKRMLVGI